MDQNQDPQTQEIPEPGTQGSQSRFDAAGQSPQSIPQTEQPSLVETAKEDKKKSFPMPTKSFIIALFTILSTITAGVAIAVYLGKLTSRVPKDQTPEPELDQSSQIVTPPVSVQEPSTPSGVKPASPSSNFQDLLRLEEEKQSSPSSPDATQPSQPLQ